MPKRKAPVKKVQRPVEKTLLSALGRQFPRSQPGAETALLELNHRGRKWRRPPLGGLGRREGTYPGWDEGAGEAGSRPEQDTEAQHGLAAVSVAQVAKHGCRQQQEADEYWRRHTRGGMQLTPPTKTGWWRVQSRRDQ